MTLVITQATTKHIIMVGDSALTKSHAGGKSYSTGCQKVQCAQKASVGVSMWGAAHIKESHGASVRIDQWVSDFILQNDRECFQDAEDREVQETSSRRLFPVDYLARRLARRLNLIDRYVMDEQRKRGFHVAGYICDDSGTPVPHVYHVRTDEADGYWECKAYLDYPDGVGDVGYERLHGGGKFTLRNGYYPVYNSLMSVMDELAKDWRSLEGFSWPLESTEDQLSFLSLQVMFIAQALILARNERGVDSRISTLAIRPDGSTLFNPQTMENADDVINLAAGDWFV